MEPNGKGMTEQELKELPEVFGTLLWQEDDGPCRVTDSEEIEWSVGFNKGVLSKCRVKPVFMWERQVGGAIWPVLRRF